MPEIPKQPELSQEERIQSATSFAELYEQLRTMRALRGSDGFVYHAEELIALIDEVRQGRKSVDYVTRTAGLRDKVKELWMQGKGGPEEESNELELAGQIPKLHDTVVLLKRSILEGERSSIEEGKRMEGVLLSEIRKGDPIVTSVGRTSDVQDIYLEDGKVIVKTETSEYELEALNS